MNILYSGDNRITDGIFMSALSLAKQCTVNIFILTSFYYMEGIESDFVKRLEKALKEINPDNKVTLIDITENFKEDFPIKNKNTRFTPACMLRLFADRIKELPDVILYLDADVICLAPPKLNLDMTGFEVAGVLDRYGKYFFRQNLLHMDYLNSGVLLLNLPEIRKNASFERCRARCKNKKMLLPDQSAINKEIRHKLFLPECFNEQKATNNNTVFRHFTTFFTLKGKVSVKPWQIDKMHSILGEYRFDGIYDELKKFKKEQ